MPATTPTTTGALEKATFLAELERNHDHNTRISILEGVFFAVGFAGVVPGTVITTFLAHYTNNKLLLNLPVFISNIPFALMPFVMSFVSSRFQTKKPVVIGLGVLQPVLARDDGPGLPSPPPDLRHGSA